MKGKSVLILLSLIIGLNSNGQPQLKFSAQAVKYDFEYLYRALEASHYNLFINNEKVVFDNEYNQRYKTIKDSMTLLQINRLFQPFTALAKQEHCAIDPPISSYINYLQGGGTLFPLNIYIKDNKLFVLDNYSSDSLIVPSDEIITINNKPVNQIMKGIYDYYSGENDYLKSSYTEGVYLFPRIYWFVYDRCDTFVLDIRKTSGELIKIKLNAISGADFEGNVAQKKPAMNNNREFRFIGNVAYLHPGQFLNVEFNGNLDHKAFNNDEFCHFIDSTFAKIHKKKAGNLIIDLRGNPGGNNTFSDYMVAYFATKPFKFSSKFLVKTSQITKDFWKDVKDSTLQSLRQEILSRKNGDCFEAEMYMNKPRTDSLRFIGKIYVLVNRYTYSNAPSTAAMIQDYKFGKLIGEITADIPTLYGAKHQFILPNTQIGVSYPKAFIIRPNGDLSSNGVIPDYIVDDNIFTDKDEVLEYTLDLIKKENKIPNH